MVRSYGMLISIVGLALAVGMGCGDDEPDDGTGGSGGTAGTGATGGAGGAAGGTGGTGGVSVCPAVSGQASTACRNSFNQLISEFLVDMEVAEGDCPVEGGMFDATITPTLNFDESFLQIAANTLCGFGIDICTTGANFTDIQVRVDALAGATCTSQVSELAGTPVTLQVPCDATCPAPNVTAPIAIPLPTVTVPCMATAASGLVSFCATGDTPQTAIAGPPGSGVDTWAEVDIGFPFPVSFQCGDGLSFGTSVACTGDPDCAAIVGNEGTVSTCNIGPPRTCSNVPIDLDPAIDCVTFGGDGGTGGTGGGTGGAGGGTGGAGGGTGGAGGATM